MRHQWITSATALLLIDSSVGRSATRRCHLPNGVKYHYEQSIALILVLNAGYATFGSVICQLRNLLRSFWEGLELSF